MTSIDVAVCGVGAGATYVYDGEYSSAFVLRVNGQPLLLLDCGVGAVRSVMAHVGTLPDYVYVSHNHTDHAGDLPVMLAVEAQRGHRMNVLAENTVLNTLITHRLHELQSTGRHIREFADFQGCQAGQLHQVCDGLALLPLKSRHAELCFGLLVYYKGHPVLGWSADSGYDAALYSALSAAPVLLLDGRKKGTSEHAGFSQLAAAASSGLFSNSKVFVYGYGRQHDAPKPDDYPCLRSVTPGFILPLSGPASTAEHNNQVISQGRPASSQTTADLAAVHAEAAAAEAIAAASAAATAAVLPASPGDAGLADVAMQEVEVNGAIAGAGWPGKMLSTVPPGATSPPASNCGLLGGLPRSSPVKLISSDKCQQGSLRHQLDVQGTWLQGLPQVSAVTAAETGHGAQAPALASGSLSGWPGARLQEHIERSPCRAPHHHHHHQQQQQQHHQQQTCSLQAQAGHQLPPLGHHAPHQICQSQPALHTAAALTGRQPRPGLSTATSTSSSTAL